MKKRRIWIAVLVAVVVASSRVYAESNQVLTLGRDDSRSHSYTMPHSGALCEVARIPVGWTLSQPLIVNYPSNVWPGQSVVFHLGETNLYALTIDGQRLTTPNGREIPSHPVQSHYSWGYMTYVQTGPTPNPSQDVIYVVTGEPGIKAYRVSDLFSPESKVKPLGEKTFPGLGIVSAPLYMGIEPGTEFDRVVISVVRDAQPDLLLIVKNLAKNHENGEEVIASARRFKGWNSGTSLRLSKNVFAVAAGDLLDDKGVSVLKEGVYFFYVDDGQHGDFDDYGTHIEVPGTSLSQLIQDPKTGYLYASGPNGTLHVIDWKQSDRIPKGGYLGFDNSGPSMDDENVYFALRWDNATPDRGRLLAMQRGSKSLLPWAEVIPPKDHPAVRPETGPNARAWINVTPITWQPPLDPSNLAKDRERILLGDTGGVVSAWTREGEQGKFFLVGDSTKYEPLPCAEVEAKSQPGPAFVYSHRAVLTQNPHTTHGDETWHNTQGIATEMTAYGGRLYAGYNRAKPGSTWVPESPAKSSLVIFRVAANVVLTDMKVELLEQGKPDQLVTDNFRLFPDDRIRVTVTVRLDADPLATTPANVGVVVGWHNGEPEQKVAELKPYEPEQVIFEFDVPKNVTSVTAAVNPAAFAYRRDTEQTRNQAPQWVTKVADPIPGSWMGIVDALPVVGDIWALDNAVTRSFATIKACDLTVDINQPAQGAEVPRDFNVGVTVRRSGCEDQANATIWMSMNKTTQGELPVTFAGNQTSAVFRLEAQPEGPITLVARVDSRNSIIETNEQNNQSSSTFSVRDDPSASCDPKTPPEDCVISVPGN